MNTFKYIIIGGGMTADSAVKGIRSIDSDGTIALFSDESDRPYNRPALSKSLWKGGELSAVDRNTPESNLEFFLDTVIASIDREHKTVTSTDGVQFSYEKLLFATGGRVRKLKYTVPGIIYYRTLADYRQLRTLTEHKQAFLVIGGGFIGTEIAAALRIAKKDVTMILPEANLGARNYPPDLSAFITDYYRQKGVVIRTGASITDIVMDGDNYVVTTQDGATTRYDVIVAGIGIEPNVELALEAGITVDHGIVVDSTCCTSDPSVYAAGDVARFFNPHLGKSIRVEHEDNANAMGTNAGRNMAGAGEAYAYLPSFYSDLFDLGYEAIGEIDARHEIVEDWKDRFHEGVIYYLADGRVRGVLLWNVWEQIDTARQLIAEPGPFQTDSDFKRIPM